MMTDFTFAATPLLYAGAGKRAQLPALIRSFGVHVLLVMGGGSFKRSQFYTECVDSLQSHGFMLNEVAIGHEPSPTDIDAVVQQYAGTNINCVVAIGGGSVLDAGKAISAMLPLNEPVTHYLEGVGNKTHTGVKIPFVAIPTTAGTGSEATKNAVLSQIGVNGFKKSLRHNNFVPNISIVDPQLTVGCPKEITAASGMDAFTQLLESYLSPVANSLTDAWAYGGLIKISQGLLRAYHTGNDLEARADLAVAAYLSGVTLANAGLGVVHGFASAVGGYYPIAHGVICSALMPAANAVTVRKLRATKQNPQALQKYATVGKLFALNEKNSDDYYVDLVLDTISRYRDEMRIPTLKQNGVLPSDYDKILSGTDCKNNPIKLGTEELEEILSNS